MTKHESLAQYQWRYRMVAMRGAAEHGVGMVRVEGALNRLGCGLDSESHPLGPEVKVTVNDRVPEGTIVYVGDPATPGTLSILAYRDGQYRHLLGNRIEAEVTVASIPGRPDEPPAWWTTPGTTEDADKIKVFKARAWRIGYKVKQQAKWCSTYEHVMARADLTEQAVRDAREVSHNGWAVGDQVQSQSQARTLPVGTVLLFDGGFVDDKRVFMVSVRDDAMTNESGCRRLLSNITGNYRNNATVVSLPEPDLAGVGDEDTDVEWAVRVTRPPEWIPSLPAGTVFAQHEGDSERWQVAEDGLVARWQGQTPSVGVHPASAFNGFGYIYLIGVKQ